MSHVISWKDTHRNAEALDEGRNAAYEERLERETAMVDEWNRAWNEAIRDVEQIDKKIDPEWNGAE